MEIEYQHLEEIARAYPELSVESVKYKDNGLVYDVLTVNNEWIFRFPKYDWSKEDMLREAACLRIASRYTTLPLPQWEIYQDTFLRYRRINGTALTPHEYEKIDAERQEEIVGQLGTFLSKLHSIPRKELQQEEIPESATTHSYDDWLKLYDDVQQELFHLMTSSARDAVDTLFRVIIADNTFTDYRPAFINGDLTDHHILFDPHTKSLTGIIDFGSAGMGDPATDIACLLLEYGETFVGRLSFFYPKMGELIDRARFIAQTYPMQWALGGVRTGDYSWLLVHLGKTGSIHPIGSPVAAC